MTPIFHALIMADVGVGKTGSIGTWPLPRVLDFDGRAKVLLDRLYPDKEITIQTMEEHRDGRGVIKDDKHFAIDDAALVFDKWCLDQAKWQTLVIDTGTTMTELCSNKGIVFNKEMKLSQTFEQAMKWGAVLPRIQDYGVERNITEQFVGMCLKFCQKHGKHFLFMCHTNDLTNDAGVVTGKAPLLTGKSAKAIPAMFSELWEMRYEKIASPPVAGQQTPPAQLRRYFQTEPDGLRTCRSDSGVSNKVTATYEAVLAALQGGKK